MAKASTRDFEIYVKLVAANAADNQALDLTDYVDIADNQAFEVHEVDIVLDPTVDVSTLAGGLESVFQLADSNIQAFVSHSSRTSLYVARQTFDPTTLDMYHQESFSSLTPLIVSKTIYCRNQALGPTNIDFTLRMKGRIVTPTAKDYMALVLTQTGNVA